MHDTTLIELFSEDLETAEQLLQLIEDEFQALSARDLTALQDILSKKMPLLALLDQHGKARSQILSALKLSTDRADLEALANSSKQGDVLLERGDQLNELLERCRSANERNGRLIRSNQHATSEVLGILRGSETPGLYDRKGSTSRTGQQRSLDQA